MFYSPSSAMQAPVIIRRASTLSRLFKTEEEEGSDGQIDFTSVRCTHVITVIFKFLLKCFTHRESSLPSKTFIRSLVSEWERKWPAVTKHSLFDFSLEDCGNPDEWYVTVSFSCDRNCIQINYERSLKVISTFFYCQFQSGYETYTPSNVWAGLTLASAHERENDSGSCMICSGTVFCSLLFRPSPRSHLQG